MPFINSKNDCKRDVKKAVVLTILRKVKAAGKPMCLQIKMKK